MKSATSDQKTTMHAYAQTCMRLHRVAMIYQVLACVARTPYVLLKRHLVDAYIPDTTCQF